MKNTKSLKNLVWYDYLTYFWLPLLAFLNFVAFVLLTMAFIPPFVSEILPTLESDSTSKISFFASMYILLFGGLFSFAFTISVRRNLKKFTSRAPKLLLSWYTLPVWFCIGFFVILYISTGSTIFDAPPAVFDMILFLIVRVFVMIPVNSLYFRKRAALFGRHFEEEPVQEPEEYIEEEPVEEPEEYIEEEPVEEVKEKPKKKSQERAEKKALAKAEKALAKAEKAALEKAEKEAQEKAEKEAQRIRWTTMRRNMLKPLAPQYYERPKQNLDVSFVVVPPVVVQQDQSTPNGK